MPTPAMPADGLDSAAAWRRLVVSVLLTTIGGVGMWSVVVVLPAVQAEFGAARGAAALPYTLTMVGFAFGGVLMGRLADRFGILAPLALGGICLFLGYGATALSTNLWQFALAHGLLIGLLGSSAAFGPLMADISLWFARRRGIAVSICAAGNYLAGTLWPPLVQHAVTTYGWRATQGGIGLFCLAYWQWARRQVDPQAVAAQAVTLLTTYTVGAMVLLLVLKALEVVAEFLFM